MDSMYSMVGYESEAFLNLVTIITLLSVVTGLLAAFLPAIVLFRKKKYGLGALCLLLGLLNGTLRVELLIGGICAAAIACWCAPVESQKTNNPKLSRVGWGCLMVVASFLSVYVCMYKWSWAPWVSLLCLLISFVICIVVIRAAGTKKVSETVAIAEGILCCVTGPYAETEIPMQDGEAVCIGSDPEMAHLIYKPDGIAPLHMEITYLKEQNVFQVVHLAENQVIVQGRPIPETAQLTAGTTLSFGDPEQVLFLK